MFFYTYEKDMKVHVDKPDFISFLLLDKRMDGTRHGLENGMKYIHQSFLLNNPTWKESLSHLGASELSMMEKFAVLIHQMHGSDARFYDESNDDTPAHELHQGYDQKMHFNLDHKHDNLDFTAVIMQDMEDETYLKSIYEELYEKITDTGTRNFIKEMIETRNKHYEILKNILDILTTHNEIKDFGLGDSHNAWDYDTENYFGKLNPEFIHIDDVPELNTIQNKGKK